MRLLIAAIAALCILPAARATQVAVHQGEGGTIVLFDERYALKMPHNSFANKARFVPRRASFPAASASTVPGSSWSTKTATSASCLPQYLRGRRAGHLRRASSCSGTAHAEEQAVGCFFSSGREEFVEGEVQSTSVSLATLSASHFMPWRPKLTCARASAPLPSSVRITPSPNLV